MFGWFWCVLGLVGVCFVRGLGVGCCCYGV